MAGKWKFESGEDETSLYEEEENFSHFEKFSENNKPKKPPEYGSQQNYKKNKPPRKLRPLDDD